MWYRLSIIYGTPVPVLKQVMDSFQFEEAKAYDRMYGLAPWEQLAEWMGHIKITRRRRQTVDEAMAIVKQSIGKARARHGQRR